MRLFINIIFVCILFFLITNPLNAQTQIVIKPITILGIPSGIMDLSLGAGSYIRFQPYKFIYPVIMGQNSLSINGISSDVSGLYYLATSSTYVLGKYYILPPNSLLSPFFAIGAGIHGITSYAEDSSPIGEKSTNFYSLKSHLFFGLELSLSKMWFFFIEGKMTYPSDIIMDSYNFGFGVKVAEF